MRRSVFSSVVSYAKDVIWGMRSIFKSCLTAIPYLSGKHDLTKEVTEQYPDPISSKTPDDLPPRSRGMLNNDIERCSGCRDCEAYCPVTCIRVEAEPATDETQIWVSIFDIDFSKCMFCGICTEVCAPGSLRHTRIYGGASPRLSDMVASFGRGPVTETQRAKWAERRKQIEDEKVRLI
ncbi:MAG TPA: hypothetical protein DCS07_14560 [Bdellovibrionales bacterium]|nr:hypothetical protein [Bdellovibrionales bacterium]HCM40694.1 hypothetical protein [Bdellovibrionales bacterium]